MIKRLLSIACILIPCFASAQTIPPEYFDLTKKADSLYRIHDYRQAAAAYSAAFKTNRWKGLASDRYHAASAWAQAQAPDSAFFQLERLAQKTDYLDLQRISANADLVSLHSDARWQRLLDQLGEQKKQKEIGYNQPLIRLLDSLKKEDQKWRALSTKYENREIDTLTIERIGQNLQRMDSLNYIQVKRIFREYGYPGSDIVGENGAYNFWLLVQHQDQHPGFQDSVLVQMKAAVDRQKASAVDYAYLLDRVKVNTGQLQVYGTQMQLNADKSSYEPKPVLEPEKLDQRRETLGMPPIRDYIKTMNERYFGTLQKH